MLLVCLQASKEPKPNMHFIPPARLCHASFEEATRGVLWSTDSESEYEDKIADSLGQDLDTIRGACLTPNRIPDSPSNRTVHKISRHPKSFLDHDSAE